MIADERGQRFDRKIWPEIFVVDAGGRPAAFRRSHHRPGHGSGNLRGHSSARGGVRDAASGGYHAPRRTRLAQRSLLGILAGPVVVCDGGSDLARATAKKIPCRNSLTRNSRSCRQRNRKSGPAWRLPLNSILSCTAGPPSRSISDIENRSISTSSDPSRWKRIGYAPRSVLLVGPQSRNICQTRWWYSPNCHPAW